MGFFSWLLKGRFVSDGYWPADYSVDGGLVGRCLVSTPLVFSQDEDGSVLFEAEDVCSELILVSR